MKERERLVKLIEAAQHVIEMIDSGMMRPVSGPPPNWAGLYSFRLPGFMVLDEEMEAFKSPSACRSNSAPQFVPTPPEETSR